MIVEFGHCLNKVYKKAHLGVLIGSQNFIHPLFTEQIVFQVVCILAIPSRWSSIHPLQLFGSLLASLLLLKTLELL